MQRGGNLAGQSESQILWKDEKVHKILQRILSKEGEGEESSRAQPADSAQ